MTVETVPEADASAFAVGRLQWRPSRLVRSAATGTAVALVVGVVLARADLIAFAAPLLGVLVAVVWQRPAAIVRAGATPALARGFEEESVRMRIRGEPVTGVSVVRVRPAPFAGLTVDVEAVDTDAGAVELDVALQAPRWGRYPVAVDIAARAPSGLVDGTVRLTVGDVHVYPLVSPRRTRLPEVALPARLGTHLTRRHGSGTEYADIRVYQPGDQLRTVNWPVTARRGRLHVTERLTDRAADVVAVIDTSMQPPGPATEALDRSVRGAVQVVQTALQEGDRAGLVVLGQRPRWLAPDIGRRQFYRVLDAVLATGDARPSTGTLAPRVAVPVGAVVVGFSTLLDTQFALALIDLRRRGHTVVAVDVLRGTPFDPGPESMLAHIWRLERASMYRDLGVVGVDVVAWHDEIELDQVMRLAQVRTAPRLRGRRRRR